MEPTPPTSTPARLERLRSDRVMAGVCGGLARHFGISPTLVRVGAIVLTLFGGAGVIAYLLMVLFVPEEGRSEAIVHSRAASDDRTLLIIVGLVAVIAAAGFGPFGWGLHRGLWALLVAGGAIALLLARDRGHSATIAPPVAPGPTPPAAPSYPSSPSAESAELDPDDADEPDAPTAATLVQDSVATATPPPAPRRRGAGRVAIGATLLVFSAAAIVALAIGGVRWDELLAGAVILTGGVLVASAFLGGARMLIPLGLILTCFAGVAAAANLDLRGGVGHRDYQPALQSDLHGVYRLAAGDMRLDLRGLTLPSGAETVVKARVGMGSLRVQVPDDVTVIADGRASAGEVRVLGHRDDGIDARRVVHRDSTPGAPVLRIDARIGLGELRVIGSQAGVQPGSGTAAAPTATRRSALRRHAAGAVHVGTRTFSPFSSAWLRLGVR